VQQNWYNSTESSSVPLLVTQPEGKPRAGVLLIHEAFGVTEHIKAVSRRLANEEYLIVAPALFHTLEDPVFRYDQIVEAKETISQLDGAQMIGDLEASVRWMLMQKELRGRPLGVLGFCFGGRLSFVTGTQIPVIAATACFYGAGIASPDEAAPIHEVAKISSPVLAVYGEQDQLIPKREVETVRTALTDAGVPNIVRTYPGAGHGFFCDARPDHFHKEAAEDAWDLLMSFFDRSLRA
jgi:carboxymethylenebutenolidase